MRSIDSLWKRTQDEAPKHWEDGKIPRGLENHPVVYVSGMTLWLIAAGCRSNGQSHRIAE